MASTILDDDTVDLSRVQWRGRPRRSHARMTRVWLPDERAWAWLPEALAQRRFAQGELTLCESAFGVWDYALTRSAPTRSTPTERSARR